MTPKNWHTLTIDEFQKVHTIIDTDYETEADRQIALVAALSQTQEEKVLRWPLEKIKAAVNEISFIYDLSTLPTKLSKFALVGKRLYTIEHDIRKLSAGQYIDFTSFAKEDTIQNLHNIMACITTPVFKRYDGRKHATIAKEIQQKMSVAQSYPIAFFFSKVWLDFTKNIQDYSAKKAMMITKEMEDLSALLKKNMAGSSPSTASRTTIKQSGNTSSR